LFKLGTEDHQANRIQAAAKQFEKAAQLDDTYADLRFRQGQCALALGQSPEAQRQFSAARDLDTLRFRCDSRINELIRQASGRQNRANVLLADAEQAFADQSPDALPGQELFYEHVHLTFEGNYLLARTIAAQAEKLLPAEIAKDASTTRPWPSLADCSRRLAWNRLESRMAFNEMLVRVADPPFTAQFNHDRMMEHLATASRAPSPTNSMEETAVSLQACEQASAALPDDPFLLKELASLRESAGDLTGAATAIQRALLLLPTSSDSWALCGLILARQQRFEDAAAAFRREFELDSQDVSALENLALCLVKQNRREQAIREYRRAVRIKPRYGPAWLGLGQALETFGNKTEAMDCFRKALGNRVHRGSDLATLARFCASRGWYEAAATNYADAIRLSPPDATLNFEAGQSLGALGHHREAAQLYANAAALAPGWAQAQFQCGLELGQSGQPAEASIRFKEATRLMPELMEARLNLAIALTNQKRYREAINEFEQVIQRSPTNATAVQYLQALRKKVSTEPGG
jgi:tetratricopeptide (TPR) repeat protein